jgi:dUTP pyrophosphatase
MKVKVINISENNLPVYETPASAGLDLKAAITEPIIIKAHDRALIPTGLKMAIPEGYECQIRPRSGLALKKGITVLNTPGTIDAKQLASLNRAISGKTVMLIPR